MELQENKELLLMTIFDTLNAKGGQYNQDITVQQFLKTYIENNPDFIENYFNFQYNTISYQRYIDSQPQPVNPLEYLNFSGDNKIYLQFHRNYQKHYICKGYSPCNVLAEQEFDTIKQLVEKFIDFKNEHKIIKNYQINQRKKWLRDNYNIETYADFLLLLESYQYKLLVDLSRFHVMVSIDNFKFSKVEGVEFSFPLTSDLLDSIETLDNMCKFLLKHEEKISSQTD